MFNIRTEGAVLRNTARWSGISVIYQHRIVIRKELREHDFQSTNGLNSELKCEVHTK